MMPPGTIRSPCIAVCALDDAGICIGCWRSIDEVAEWSCLDDDARRAVLQRCLERAAGAGQLL